ncbi:uncharacterized protein LOC113232475 [Hyposmocoma kahamanoa]|uniref:uncharacterized protein LOC113232475 n=1 Tax=Hyposmocoma kahamanoa TaxID=1477025 RepID=UPI000E6D8678|nr:uncharacterized protein LOC113232475 [Hyposmocoma kahamanoa]
MREGHYDLCKLAWDHLSQVLTPDQHPSFIRFSVGRVLSSICLCGSYTVALGVTVGAGCFLLALNVLVFAGIYLQRGRARRNRRRHHRQGSARASSGTHLDRELSAVGADMGASGAALSPRKSSLKRSSDLSELTARPSSGNVAPPKKRVQIKEISV